MLNDEDVKYAKEKHVTAYIPKEQHNAYPHRKSDKYASSTHKIGRVPAKSSRHYIVSLNGIDYYAVSAHSLKEAIVVINEKVGANPPSPNPPPPPPGQTVTKTRSKAQSIPPYYIKRLIQNNRLIELNDETKRITDNPVY